MEEIIITPISKITKPEIRNKQLKKGLRVSITYYNNYKEYCKSLLDPTEEDIKKLYDECKDLCYKMGDKIKIKKDMINDFIIKNFRIIEEKIEYEEKEVPIPPYILGIWLGDGHSNCICLTNIDKNIIDVWENYAKDNNMKITLSDKKNRKTEAKDYETDYVSSYRITNGLNKPNKILEIFKKLNLIKNKHIPEIYLKNSEKNRLELLAGIIDTDGYKHRNTYEIVQKNKLLSINIEELAKNLGFNVCIKEIIKHCKNSKKKDHSGLYYKINISTNNHSLIIPVLCERKKKEDDTKCVYNKNLNKNKDKIIWTKELDIELISTIEAFKKLEPNQRIPWAKLYLYNNNFVENKNEAYRARYRDLQKNINNYNKLLANIKIIKIDNLIDKEWLNKSEQIKEILKKKEKLPKKLDEWYRNQINYLNNNNLYKDKKDILDEIKQLKDIK